MDFRISNRGKKNGNNSNNVVISKDVAERLLDVLSNVECTCVWSEHDQEYLKVHNIDRHLVDDLKSAISLSRLTSVH